MVMQILAANRAGVVGLQVRAEQLSLTAVRAAAAETAPHGKLQVTSGRGLGLIGPTVFDVAHRLPRLPFCFAFAFSFCIFDLPGFSRRFLAMKDFSVGS